MQAAGGNPNVQLSAARQATLRRRLVRQSTRGDHLPARSKCAEQARMLRCLKGYPPLGSSAEADQLSDLEESIEVGKHHAIRFGERYIVQIGRRRTMREEELSNEDDDVRRVHTIDASAADGVGQDDAMSDSEGGPGPFLGGHTGHAQAEAQQAHAIEAQRRARDAEAEANRAAAAATAARNQAARQAAIQQEEDAIDLDADIEDLDQADDDDVDFD